MTTVTKRERTLELLLDRILDAGDYEERDIAARVFHVFVSAIAIERNSLVSESVEKGQ